jgi:hypothetical protein
MNCHPQKQNQKLQIFQKEIGSLYWWAYNANKSEEKMKKSIITSGD